MYPKLSKKSSPLYIEKYFKSLEAVESISLKSKKYSYFAFKSYSVLVFKKYFLFL